MNKKIDRVTVFTPTYNRGYILKRAYDSLLKQTNKNFEWLIVDDGSTDDTKNIVKEWIKEKKIQIRYIYQHNQGKPTAHNTGVLNAKYDLFFCLDSDDFLTNDSIETILKEYEKIYTDDKITGLIAKRQFLERKDLPAFPLKETMILLDLVYKYNYKYDLLLVYKKKYLKQFLFPSIPNEKFIPEPYVYNQIDQLGTMLLIDKELYICEYLEDGYSRNVKQLIKNNPIGYMKFAKQEMMLAKNIKLKFIDAVRYSLGCILAGKQKELFEVEFLYKILIMLVFPITILAYIKKYTK